MTLGWVLLVSELLIESCECSLNTEHYCDFFAFEHTYMLINVGFYTCHKILNISSDPKPIVSKNEKGKFIHTNILYLMCFVLVNVY
jgi:hypothetical protein